MARTGTELFDIDGGIEAWRALQVAFSRAWMTPGESLALLECGGGRAPGPVLEALAAAGLMLRRADGAFEITDAGVGALHYAWARDVLDRGPEAA